MSGRAIIAIGLFAGAAGLAWPRLSQAGGGLLVDNVSWAPTTEYNPTPDNAIPWPPGNVEIGPITVVGSDDTNTGTIYRDPDLPRGIRNNNPGNLKRVGINWRGKSDEQTDAIYVQFDSPHWGIRAMARDIKTDRRQDGANTVAEIIHQWAPPGENDTAAYIAHVAAAMGISATEPFAPTLANKITLISTIIEHENGYQPYSTDTLIDGIQAA